jgi:hypothetical protein
MSDIIDAKEMFLRGICPLDPSYERIQKDVPSKIVI